MCPGAAGANTCSPPRPHPSALSSSAISEKGEGGEVGGSRQPPRQSRAGCPSSAPTLHDPMRRCRRRKFLEKGLRILTCAEGNQRRRDEGAAPEKLRRRKGGDFRHQTVWCDVPRKILHTAELHETIRRRARAGRARLTFSVSSSLTSSAPAPLANAEELEEEGNSECTHT